MKPADRLNNLFQRLQHPIPSYETEEHRSYTVRLHLSQPTQQLVAAPERAGFKRLLDRACAGKKAASVQKSKEIGMDAVCDVLELILGTTTSPLSRKDRRSKRKHPLKHSGNDDGAKVQQEPGAVIGTNGNGVAAGVPSLLGKRARRGTARQGDALRPIVVPDPILGDDDESSSDDRSLFVSQHNPDSRRPPQLDAYDHDSPSSDTDASRHPSRRSIKRARRSAETYGRGRADAVAKTGSCATVG